MLKVQIIGIGQGANNACIHAIQKEAIRKDDVLLINTTVKDIPVDYRDITVKLGKFDGMGKQRELGKKVILESIQDGSADVINTFIKPDTDIVLVLGTTSGGTGSGMTPTIASYIQEVLEKKSICVGFTGSHDDPRGLLNTVGFFKDMSENLTVMIIPNEKFFKETSGNLMRIHKLANEAFVQKLNILSGRTIVDSSLNMDDSDLFKAVSLPGLLFAEYSVIDRNLKSIEQYNKIISNMINDAISIDVKNPKAKRISIIFNASESTQENIDFTHTVLKEKLGDAPEIYNHIQYESDVEFINVIASGMRLPLEEVKDIYERYQERMSNFSNEDNFHKELKGLSSVYEMAEFDSQLSSKNTIKNNEIDKSSFLSKFKMEEEQSNNQDNIDSLKEKFLADKY